MNKALGYTIIEVLIVLAISGLMFAVSFNFINGKQEKASFTEGTNDMASQVQDVVEQVTDGQYSDIPLTCAANAGSTSASVNSSLSSNGTDQTYTGINSPCVFLGKILQLPGPTGTQYSTASLAAQRVTQGVTGLPVTPTLQNTFPTVIGGLTKSKDIPQQLNIKSVGVVDATAPTGSVPNLVPRNFGFAIGLGSVAGAGFQSGAQTISMIYSPSPAVTGAGLQYARAVTICMTDNVQYATLTIGGDNNASQLNITRKVVTSC